MSSATACSIAALLAGSVSPFSEWKITFEEYSVSSGKRSSMASAARCESEPGSLKLSSYSPPCEVLSMKIAPAMKIQAAMTRHGWRPAKLPMR